MCGWWFVNHQLLGNLKGHLRRRHRSLGIEVGFALCTPLGGWPKRPLPRGRKGTNGRWGEQPQAQGYFKGWYDWMDVFFCGGIWCLHGHFLFLLYKLLISWTGDEVIYIYIYVYIYMGSGRFPGPMELLLQQLVRVSKTRWRWFNLSKSMLLQPLIKKLEVLVMINQWTTYCINDNNDERWMVVLIDFYLTFWIN